MNGKKNDETRTPLNLRILAETRRLLELHSILDGQTMSSIVDELVAAHLDQVEIVPTPKSPKNRRTA